MGSLLQHIIETTSPLSEAKKNADEEKQVEDASKGEVKRQCHINDKLRRQFIRLKVLHETISVFVAKHTNCVEAAPTVEVSEKVPEVHKAAKPKVASPAVGAEPVHQQKHQQRHSTDWQIVAPKPAKRAVPKKRPAAILVQSKGGMSYSDMLKLETRSQDAKLQAVGKSVQKVRRTAKGDLLLELNQVGGENVSKRQQDIDSALEGQVEAESLANLVRLDVLEMNKEATKAEICQAVSMQLSLKVTEDNIKSLRPSYGGSRKAILCLPANMAEPILKAGQLKIGYSVCRVRLNQDAIRCYRCLAFGHVAARCQDPIDRTNWCLKCGSKDHKVRDCTNNTNCCLCAARGVTERAHIAGSLRCPSANASGQEKPAAMFNFIKLNHCEAAHELLKQRVRETRTDVAIISEPFRRMSAENWICSNSGKAVLWACGSPNAQLRSRLAGGHFVRALINGKWIYSCYFPPSLDYLDFCESLDELAEDARAHSPFVIAGDFNAWAQEWGSSITNDRGRAVLESLASLDVALLNCGSRNTFNSAGRGSIIDLTFVSNSLARFAAWRWDDNYTASDHEAIIFSRPEDRQPDHNRRVPRQWNYHTKLTRLTLRHFQLQFTMRRWLRDLLKAWQTSYVACWHYPARKSLKKAILAAKKRFSSNCVTQLNTTPGRIAYRTCKAFYHRCSLHRRNPSRSQIA
ncbi:uncharacterized protein [Drosophila tropicalis]|uniref:uncharacterized protein n=1 Tax=Drosophila tropicalis TaxID=46794 RepID=UPI0035AB89A4